MLDLNFSVTQMTDLMNCEEDEDMKTTIMEDSETSNSSVVSNGRDEDSSVLIFDIIKKETEDGLPSPSTLQSPDLITKPLFPVTGNNGGWDLTTGGLLGTSISPVPRPHWLNLSAPDSSNTVDGAAELKIAQQKQPPVKKSRRGPRSRSSQYRGVTFYRRTGRWESHIWDCGKQVYLGGFDTAHSAARAYDRAAIKFRGIDADINFNISDYDEDMKQMKNLGKEEFVRVLRRQSTGFSRGGSKLRGLSLQKYGRWETQMAQTIDKIYDGEALKTKNDAREALLTNFEQQIKCYKGETMQDVNNELGNNDHNLDLSLGISLTSYVPKATNDINGVFNHHHLNIAPQKLNIEKPKNEYVGGHQPQILSIASKDPPSAWSDFYCGFLPNNEERGREKRIEGICSAKIPNWVWKIQEKDNNILNNNNNYKSAASSGFSPSVTSSSSLPFYAQNNSTHHFLHSTVCFPLPTPPSTSS